MDFCSMYKIIPWYQAVEKKNDGTLLAVRKNFELYWRIEVVGGLLMKALMVKLSLHCI